MAQIKSTIFVLIVLLQYIVAPPVTKNKGKEQDGENADGLEEYMEYHRYLREVVSALESDPEFKQKLEKASEDDIRSGKIAHELEFVSHHVRTRLDEIKRTELERLRDLTQKKIDLMENNVIDDPTHHHLDHDNKHTFEIEDLKKLIAKTTADLAEADRKRREEFKQYEMQKEFEKLDKLNHTNGEEREKLEKEYKELEDKHKKHEKLHEPIHKKQLEEVWEEQDNMQQDFDPKTFFMLHDLDGNGLWDETEVKALFVKELDKMYQQGAPEDDMRERMEEMERMRETVFAEVDLNRDGFIDYQEFLAQTKKNDFQQDHGWQGLDEQKVYTDEEMNQYIAMQQAQAQYGGHPPPGGYHGPPSGYHGPPGGYHPSGGYQGPPGGYHQEPPHGGYQPPPGNHHPQAYQAPQGGYHPNAVPQGHVPQQLHPGQLPQAQVHPQSIGNQVPPHGNPNIPNFNHGNAPDLNTNEIYQNHQVPQHQGQQPQGQGQQQVPQVHQQQVPPQQVNQQQVPPQQVHQQQVPPQQVHQQQVPPQKNHQQVPQQQVPSQQVHQQQVPQQQLNQAQQQQNNQAAPVQNGSPQVQAV